MTASSPTVAQELYWDGAAGWTGVAPGSGGNGTWADGSGAWDPAKTAIFTSAAGTVTTGSVTAGSGLAFFASGYTLSGGTVSLTGTSIGLNTITTGSTTLLTTTINSVLAGSAGMTKLGAGRLVLGGANTFSGNVAVNAGTLEIAADSALGDAANDLSVTAATLKTTASVSLGVGRVISGSGTLDIAPGTTLTSNGSFTTTGVMLANGGTLDLRGSTRSVGVLTFGTAATVNGSGAISLTGLHASTVTSGSAIVNAAITFTSNKTVEVGAGGTLVLNGDIAGSTGRFTKVDAGTLIASGSNSTSGYRLGIADAATRANGGTLILTDVAASGTGQLQFNYGTLKSTAPLTFANGLAIGGRSGALAVLGGTNTMVFSGSSNFYRGAGTSGYLRFDVNNSTSLNGAIGPTNGSGTASEGIMIGGTGTLAINGDASLLGETITLQDSVDLLVGGTLGSAVNVGAGNVIGGDGLIVGSLRLASGAGFIFDMNKTLTVNGASVSFGGFGITDLIGFSPAVPNGSYKLIDGSSSVSTSNLNNLGAANAYDLGGGRSAYFEVGSLTLLVVPEPSAFVLTSGVFLACAVAWRRRRSPPNPAVGRH